MKVFFLTGIGADERMFVHIRLPEGLEAVHIPWIPALPGETLTAYAHRLFLPYHTAGQPFALVGLSLGGIMSSEIAKVFPPVCTILISSVPVSTQLPPYYRLVRKLGLHRWVPPALWKTAAIANHYLMMKSWKDKQLMRSVIWQGDASFIRWGMDAVLAWKNEVLPYPYYHIHGTRDTIFPLRFTRPTHVLRRAGHMAVISHAGKVNQILGSILCNTRKAGN